MESNVTIRLNSEILRKARHIAVEEDLSLSRWIAKLIMETASTTSSQSEFAKVRKRAIARVNKGFNLGGTRYSRDELHQR